MEKVQYDEQADVYFAVPTHYTIGDTFATYAEAAQAARDTIEAFDFGGYSRAFVDVRIRDAKGDRPLARIEIVREAKAHEPKEGTYYNGGTYATCAGCGEKIGWSSSMSDDGKARWVHGITVSPDCPGSQS